MTSANRYLANPAVIAQTIGDETVFFHTDRGQYLSLDPVGSRMYALLLEHGRIGASDAVLEEYEVDRATVDADMERLINRLLTAGIIEPKPE